MSKQKILVTAALPYVNNVPHMGVIVGSHLPADIFYRYCRARGHDAVFVGGSDDYGTPAVVAAKELGIEPKKLVERLHQVHKRIYERLGIDYTNYSRTSNESHRKTAQEFFLTIHKRGFVHKKTASMHFCENDRMFLPDRFIVGTCPRCGYQSANADECEKCTSIFDPQEVIGPHCRICGSVPVMKKTTHFYLDLARLSKRLNQWVEGQKGIWRHHVFSEAKKWINEGLRSRPITRDIDWGIKVPLAGFDNKVLYVWFDAPIGYITFTQELGKNLFHEYWEDPESQIYHFIGKDNIPFHTIFWPAMLLAHGNLNLPSKVVGLNYLNFEGQKFSKSKGIGVFCHNLLDSDLDIDVLRSYLTMVIPETADTSFSWKGFRTITNSELIGKLGNLFNRTLSLIWNNFGGRIDCGYEGLSDLGQRDQQLVESIRNTPNTIGSLFFKPEFRKAY